MSTPCVTECPWRCGICKRHHSNACPAMWGGDLVPAPCGHDDPAAVADPPRATREAAEK